jgi:hypothetical protein
MIILEINGITKSKKNDPAMGKGMLWNLYAITAKLLPIININDKVAKSGRKKIAIIYMIPRKARDIHNKLFSFIKKEIIKAIIKVEKK